jgi:hypothetical protein
LAIRATPPIPRLPGRLCSRARASLLSRQKAPGTSRSRSTVQSHVESGAVVYVNVLKDFARHAFSLRARPGTCRMVRGSSRMTLIWGRRCGRTKMADALSTPAFPGSSIRPQALNADSARDLLEIIVFLECRNRKPSLISQLAPNPRSHVCRRRSSAMGRGRSRARADTNCNKSAPGRLVRFRLGSERWIEAMAACGGRSNWRWAKRQIRNYQAPPSFLVAAAA